MKWSQVYVCVPPQSGTPFQSPSRTVPLDCPIARALGALLHAWNLHSSSTLHWVIYESESSSVLSDSLRPHELYSPWNSPGQSTGVGSLSLLQGIFPTQGSNPGLLHCRQILCQLNHKGSPRILEWVAYPFFRGSFWPRNQTGSPALQVDSLLTEPWGKPGNIHASKLLSQTIPPSPPTESKSLFFMSVSPLLPCT